MTGPILAQLNLVGCLRLAKLENGPYRSRPTKYPGPLREKPIACLLTPWDKCMVHVFIFKAMEKKNTWKHELHTQLLTYFILMNWWYIWRCSSDHFQHKKLTLELKYADIWSSYRTNELKKIHSIYILWKQESLSAYWNVIHIVGRLASQGSSFSWTKSGLSSWGQWPTPCSR